MGHVARAPWDMLRGLHGTCCEGSMGHVARACCEGFRESRCEGSMRHVVDMLRETCCDGTCCKGSMGHVASGPWDILQGLHGTCCRAPWDML